MKTKLQFLLATIAPSIAIDTIWRHDEDARWDIQDKELNPDDYQAWESEVRATAIAMGRVCTGSAYLCGTWEKFGDNPAMSNPDISGYEMQMTERALDNLLSEGIPPATLKEAKEAIAKVQQLMRESYDEHQKKKTRKRK